MRVSFNLRLKITSVFSASKLGSLYNNKIEHCNNKANGNGGHRKSASSFIPFYSVLVSSSGLAD